MYKIKVFQGSLTGSTCRSVVLWLDWGGGGGVTLILKDKFINFI